MQVHLSFWNNITRACNIIIVSLKISIFMLFRKLGRAVIDLTFSALLLELNVFVRCLCHSCSEKNTILNTARLNSLLSISALNTDAQNVKTLLNVQIKSLYRHHHNYLIMPISLTREFLCYPSAIWKHIWPQNPQGTQIKGTVHPKLKISFMRKHLRIMAGFHVNFSLLLTQSYSMAWGDLNTHI